MEESADSKELLVDIDLDLTAQVLLNKCNHLRGVSTFLKFYSNDYMSL
jgi:hypothetical protein